MSEITDAEVHNPNMQEYLASISKREGTTINGYNTQVGGGRFEDLSKHPNNPTVVTDAGVSTAAGKYQHTGTTWRGLQKQYPQLTDFSPENQDRGAVALIKEKDADKDIAAGNYAAADAKLTGVWDSLNPPEKRAKVLTPAQRGISGTTLNTNPVDNLGNSPSDKVMSQLQADEKPFDPVGNIVGGVQTAWNNDLAADPIFHAVHSAINSYKDMANNKVVDPAWSPTREQLLQASTGVKSQYLNNLVNDANSMEELMRNRDKALAYDKQEEAYQQMGFGSGLARLGMGLIAPTNFAVMAMAAAAPELGIPTAIGRFGRFGQILADGAVGGAVNAGIEAATYKNRPDGAFSDVGYAALMGFGLGAAGGAVGSLGRKLEGHGGIFSEDLRNIQHWSAEEIHNLGAEDYTKLKLVGEADVHNVRTPEEKALRELELHQEYTDLLHKRTLETVHSAGDMPYKGGKTATDIPKAPEVVTWGKEFDTPHYIKDTKGVEHLQLPPKQSLNSLMDYIIKFSKNESNVAWLKKLRETVDVANIKYYEHGHDATPSWYTGRDKLKSNHLAFVQTPVGSLGSKEGEIYFASRGKAQVENAKGNTVSRTLSRGDDRAVRTGLTDVTFLHELSHVAGVFKQRLHTDELGKPTTVGKIVGDEKTMGAVKGIYDLHKTVMKMSGLTDRNHYGLTNAREFLSEGISNSHFQEFLKSIKLPADSMGGTAFSKFVNHMMDLLGLDRTENTAFHKFLELSDALTDEGGISREGSVVSGSPHGGYRPSPDGKATTADAIAAAVAQIPPVWAIGLSLENRLYKSGLPDAVHLLANKLFGSSVGYQGHGVVGTTVWDDHKLLSKGWNMQLRKGALVPFVEYLHENKVPMMGQGKAHDDFFEKVWEHVHGWDGEYDPLVVRASQAMQKNYSEVVKHINNPLHSVGGTKLGLTENEATLLDGTKKIQGTLAEDPNYMPRQHDSNKWDRAYAKLGDKGVRQWWSAAFMDARDSATTSTKDADMFAKWYCKTVNTAQDQAASQHLTDMVRGQDRPALMESLKDILNLEDDEAARLADVITGQTKDANGQLSGSLKHRSNINEKFVGGVGTAIEGVSLKDFVKTNAFNITEGYNDRMSGLISLAKNMDIYRVSDISKAIGEAVKDTEVGAGGITPKQGRNQLLTNAAKDLQFAFDRILGVPQVEGFSPWRKGAEMLRNFNVIRLMSGAVYNQLVETSTLAGTVGWKAMIKSVPEMGGLFRDMTTGNLSNEVLNHIENYTGGAGGEYLQRLDYASHTAWRDHMGDTKAAGVLDKLDYLISKGASGVLNKTGMTGLMVQQKRNFALSFVNGLIDISHGIEHGGAAYLTKERLAHLGYSEEDFGKLKVALKKYTSETQEGVILPEIKKFDIKGFMGEEPELHHQLMTAVMRESDRVIQENDLAAMVPFMGTTVGQLGFQFMGFSMQAWNKQLMYSMHHRDAATVNTMFHGLFFGTLVYSARIYQQSLGMEESARKEYLAKHLTPAKAIANGFSRMGASSMLPNLASTFIPNAAELFSGGRTTSDLSGLMSNPTLGLANSVITLAKKSVTNPLDPQKQFNRADMNSLSKLMPLNNMIGINNVLNSINSHYPVSSKETQ